MLDVDGDGIQSARARRDPRSAGRRWKEAAVVHCVSGNRGDQEVSNKLHVFGTGLCRQQRR